MRLRKSEEGNFLHEENFIVQIIVKIHFLSYIDCKTGIHNDINLFIIIKIMYLFYY